MSVDSNMGKVAVAMSGGVDSSVAAALLVQSGYEVIGLTMKLFDRSTTGVDVQSERGCCNLEAIHRAQSVCHTLNIPHHSIDLMDDFKDYVIEDFINEYIDGRTPNPCVRCNAYLKWGSLFQKARMVGCDILATGHYARIEKVGGEYRLLRASNRDKDQSYALWGIPLEKLSDTILPLGTLRKQQVRKIAADLGLKSAETPESQEICFIPDGHYAEFIKTHRPDFFQSLPTGELMMEEEGELIKIGEHPGYPFYTVGQRRGLGGGHPEPQYVLRVDPELNRVVIGGKGKLFTRSLTVDQLNWLIPVPDRPIHAQVQVRYRSTDSPAKITPIGNSGQPGTNYCTVQFDHAVEAVAPGQSAVFYRKNRLIGGGRILNVLADNIKN